MQTEQRRWAVEEFATCELADTRHVKRLVTMASVVASAPAGKVTEVFQTSAEREGAFRFLENEAVEVDALQRAVRAATLRRCVETKASVVIVAVDATSISLSDRAALRTGFGKVGAWKDRGRGLHVMNALAMTTDGTPLGLCDQRWWARSERKTGRHDLRPVWDRETTHWTHSLCVVQDAFAWKARNVRPWFQLDRGGDCWPVLMLAVRGRMLLTVRSVDRRHVEAGPGKYRYLWHAVQSGRVVGYVDVDVPARDDRPARRARLAVRAQPVTVRLQVKRRKYEEVTLNAVLATEIVGDGAVVSDPLEWRLLTTASIATFADTKSVIRNYALRWRIEDFHRAWKSGVCGVEDSQLRTANTFVKWATILATVATRALRLTHAARNTPEVPSTTEFSSHEIDAVLILKKKDRFKADAPPKLGELVGWIADIGGYTGKSSGGPPGPVVIGRGLERIRGLAEGLQNLAAM
jgi:Transposase DNA-binding/Transposase DDE domain